MNDTLAKTYSLPQGYADMERLQLQHQVWFLLLDDFYPPEIGEKVQHLMRHAKPEILDVGCGSTPYWSIQMAERFPNANVVGFDLAPLYPGKYPPNFSFRNYNLADGLPTECKAKFDIIHSRTVCMHVPDPPMLIDSMIECLKPGGLLLLGESIYTIHDKDKQPLAVYEYNPSLSVQDNIKNMEGFSWHATGYWELGRVMSSPKYKHPSELIKKTPLAIMFEKDLLTPVGWGGKGIKNGKQIGELMLKNVSSVYAFGSEISAKLCHIPAEFWDELLMRGFEELSNGNMYMVYAYVVASKPRNTL